MNTETIAITKRTRTLGYGWTNSAVRRPDGIGSEIAAVRGPSVVGTVGAVQAERDNMLRLCSGGLYRREALFVGGRRVVDWDGGPADIGTILAELADGETVTVHVAAVGRPRSGEQAIRSTLAIRLTPALRAALDARAERDETSIGAVVRAAIEAYVGRQ